MKYVLPIIFLIIGLVIGFFICRVLIFKNVGAVLHIDKTNPEKDSYTIVLIMPFNEIDKKKYVVMKIQEDK